MDYKIVRSDRRTLAVSVTLDGVIIRAPRFSSNTQIENFVREYTPWIEKHLKALEDKKEKLDELPPLTKTDINGFMAKCREVIPERVRYYAEKIGVTYTDVKYGAYVSIWGSCTQKGVLKFNCLLMAAPDGVIDSVIVHELCHRLQMNHSPAFYELVYKAMPDYKDANAWIRKNGSLLIERMKKGSVPLHCDNADKTDKE